ncbi:MAG: hypothetical protein ABIG60_05940 [Patescibacteria group bacterium]
MPTKKKKTAKASQPTSLKAIVGALVKKAETNEDLKGDLLELTADIAKNSSEFKDEIVRAVLASKNLRNEAVKEIIDGILD